MATTIPNSRSNGHPVLPDLGKLRMANADVQTPDIDTLRITKADAQNPDIDWNAKIGQAVQRAVAIVGWSNKEAAAVLMVDDAEFGKWVSGTRRPQFDKLFAAEALRWPLVRCLAEMSGTAVAEERLRRLA